MGVFILLDIWPVVLLLDHIVTVFLEFKKTLYWGRRWWAGGSKGGDVCIIWLTHVEVSKKTTKLCKAITLQYIYIYVIIIKELLTVFNSGCISFLIFMYSSGSESHSVGSSSLQPHRLYSPWNSPGQNTGVNNLFLLHGIIPTQGSKPGLQHCRHIFYRLSHKGSPVFHVCCCCC